MQRITHKLLIGAIPEPIWKRIPRKRKLILCNPPELGWREK